MQEKEKLIQCLTCRRYLDIKYFNVSKESYAPTDCFECENSFNKKMRKLRNKGFGSIGGKERKTTEIKHDIEYIAEVLKEFGINRGAAKLDTTEWLLKAHLKKYDISIKDFSKKPRTTFEEILGAMTDQELAKELKEMGITSMKKKYKCDFYKIKNYLANRLGNIF